MNNQEIMNYLDKQYDSIVDSIKKSAWYCPNCRHRMVEPILNNIDADLDGGTDFCPVCLTMFQIRGL